VNTDSKTVPERSAVQGGKSVAPTKKKADGAASKAARPAKTPTNSLRSSRAASSTEKLVCRYCGSDDCRNTRVTCKRLCLSPALSGCGGKECD
jgi:hypothetical protein